MRLGMGLVATMTALLLGLVTASARSTFDSQDTALRTSASNILTLDRLLARYGPETKATRDLIRQAVAFRIQTTWPDDGSPAPACHRTHAAHRSRKSKTRSWNWRRQPTPSAGSRRSR